MVSPICDRVSSISWRIASGSWPIARPPSPIRLLVLGLEAWPLSPCCGPAARARPRSPRTPPREPPRDPPVHDRDDQRCGPVGDGAVEQQDEEGRERAEGHQAEQPRSAEHPGALARLLTLLRELGLREVKLLLHERRRLLGELLQELPDRTLVQVGSVVVRHR